MPEIKICGVGDASFALEAARLGVDYLGFIFEPASPRCVDAATAAAIASRLEQLSDRRPAPRLVGVFVRQTPAEILETMDRARLDVIQLHRRATESDVTEPRASGREVWALAGGAVADGVLFDSSHGDGESAFRRGAYKSILAGRLSAANAAEAIAAGADVLDFNSSLEDSPGRKSIPLLRALFAALRR